MHNQPGQSTRRLAPSPFFRFVYRPIRRLGTPALLIFTALSAAACNPALIAVNPDGTFTPDSITIRAGETVTWFPLFRTDAIVQIGDPSQFPQADPCGITDNDLDHPFAAEDPNEFTGPLRKGVSGIFVLGEDGPGLVQRLASESCACESLLNPCIPRQVTSLDGNTYKLCPNEGATNELLQTTWDNPDIAGVILRLDWKAIQVDSGGTIVFDWTDLDREMNRAVENGKLFTLDVSAGRNGTPEWIFSNYTGPAGPGPVVPYTFKDWGSSATPPFNNCGYDMTLGSPADSNYRALYADMIEALAEHVASDSRWFQALAHVKISGVNLLTSEARLPNRCYDGDSDGVLDTIGRDDCLCNAKIWAVEAGYTPSELYRYYREIGNTIYNAFFQRKSLGYQLIQAGFPRVVSTSNFEGDSLRDQSGDWLLDPPGTPSDDINGVTQTEQVLLEGHEGRFIDPSGQTTDLVAGKLFVPQHSGLANLPDDLGLAPCSQAMPVDPITHKADFPIPDNVSGGRGSGCPNRWAVDHGTLYSQIMGFQTGNTTTIDSSDALESALWNLTINSNGVFLEIYEQIAWEIYHTQGTDSTAAVLDANRVNLVGNPAPYSKNLFAWAEELHERRRMLVDETNPHTADPFPVVHKHTFTKAISAPATYYYINPSRCGQTTNPSRVGRIIVIP